MIGILIHAARTGHDRKLCDRGYAMLSNCCQTITVLNISFCAKQRFYGENYGRRAISRFVDIAYYIVGKFQGGVSRKAARPFVVPVSRNCRQTCKTGPIDMGNRFVICVFCGFPRKRDTLSISKPTAVAASTNGHAPPVNDTTRLLAHVYNEAHGQVCIHTARRENDELTNTKERFFDWPQQAGAAVAWIEEESREDREVYFCTHQLKSVDGRTCRQKEYAADRVTCLWVERDAATIPEHLPQPTATVESSPGRYHDYYRLDRPVCPDRAENLNCRLTNAIGGDAGWHLTKLLRPPGTRNRKYPGSPPVKLSFVSDNAYDPDELDQLLPSLADEPVRATHGREKPADEPPLTDQGVIAEAERIHGDEFKRLYYKGDASKYNGNQSSARWRLLQIVRGYTHDDVDQTERIMRRSNLRQSRFDELRPGGITFIRWEVEKALDEPADWYYEIGGDLPPEFVSCHYKNPPDRKQNEMGKDESVSCHGGGANDGKQNLDFKSVQDIIEECGDGPDWIAHGFIARDWLTDLVGPAKRSGKTTLVMYLVRCILDGCPFLDYLTTKTNVVYLTEQASSVVEAIKKAGLDERNEGLRILQWKDARDRSWSELVEDVVQHAKNVDAGLIIVDTLNRFAGLKGEEENNAGAVAEVMAVLMGAAQKHNVAMLSIRHANKEGKARGSTQFDYDVDALFELQPYGGNENMRVLEGIGRSDEIPSKLTIELGPEGYSNLGSGDSVRFKMAVRAIKEVVSTDAKNPTPGPALIDTVREEYGVAEKTARRALAWLCDQDDDIVRTGEGKRGSPYTYYVPPVEVG